MMQGGIIDEHDFAQLRQILGTGQKHLLDAEHIFQATAQALERDTDRLQAGFACTNRGPLGAAALTTTGFAIDRELTARLLGFDSVVVNSYDAIGGVDYALESLNALSI